MDQYPERFMVLLIDFDNHVDRLDYVKAQVPARLAERVLVLGALNEPEDLKSATAGSMYESIGMEVAADCSEGTGRYLGTPASSPQCRRAWPTAHERCSDSVSLNLIRA